VNSAVKAGREAEDGRINRSKSGNSLEIPPVSREREREREAAGFKFSQIIPRDGGRERSVTPFPGIIGGPMWPSLADGSLPNRASLR